VSADVQNNTLASLDFESNMILRDLRSPETPYGTIQLDDNQSNFDSCMVRFNKLQDNEIFVAANNYLSIYHTNQGSAHSQISQHEFPDNISSIVQDKDLLLVTCDDGCLYSFDWNQGQIRGSYPDLGRVRLGGGAWNKGKSLAFVNKDSSLTLLTKS
jgi:hypothetical protein